VAIESVKDALALRNFCNRFNVLHLKNKCEQFLSEHVDEDSVWEHLDELYKPPHVANKLKVVSLTLANFQINTFLNYFA